MSNDNTERKPTHFMRWFDPRGMTLGTFAFILHRVSGIGLVVYLFLHLAVLSQLAQGPGAYDAFIALVKNPWFILGEFIVVAGVLLHGMNGLRIAVTSFGPGAQHQKQIFLVLISIALIGCVIFAFRMFGGA